MIPSLNIVSYMNISVRATAIKKILIALLAASTVLGLACSGGDSNEEETSSNSSRLRVVTSISVLKDMAQEVGGDRVEVTSLIPAGADVHTFQLVPKDLVSVKDADIVIFNGLNLEAPVEDAVMNVVDSETVVVMLAEGLEELALEAGYEHDSDGNPHLWLDPIIAMEYIKLISSTFQDADSLGAPTYRDNAARYTTELESLNLELSGLIGSIPENRRKLVTFHDAFPYFASRYGLELVGVVIESPGREPSAKELDELLQQIRDTGVSAVYTEPQFNARILELLASDAGIQVLTLYSDALDDVAGSYVEMMRFNTQQLVKGLK